MVDLRAKPFYLTDKQIEWVQNTIRSMTLEEKISQLFVHLTASVEEEDVLNDLKRTGPIGGIRFNPGTKENMRKMNYNFQKASHIPILSAVNVEQGGTGATKDGTFVGSEMKIAATGEAKYAYELGRICGIETKSVGCNWAFAPITDLVMNWHNPGISTRGWSNDPDRILELSKEYYRGMKESGIACAMKHFPGDGCDERDPHVATAVNSLSCEEWDATYGKVYKGMIDEGIESVMIGHIMMPAYQKHFNPEVKDNEYVPATLSTELLGGLLREKLGFNGLIVTDASHMIGLAGRAKRSELVPRSIAAGCDLFLFFNDIEEDLGYMTEGYKNGIITEERLTEALERILGLKAMLGLDEFKLDEFAPLSELDKVGKKEYLTVTSEIADKGITLAKQVGENIFPLTPEKTKRILLVSVGPHPNPSLSRAGMGVDGSKLTDQFKAELEAKGFEVSVYVDPIKAKLDKIEKVPKWLLKILMNRSMNKQSKGMYGMKRAIHNLHEKYDCVIAFANVSTTMKTTQRLEWALSKGGWDNSWYVNELPTIFVSFNCPFHLADVSQVKNYINCYDAHPITVKKLVEKLVGQSEFKGKSPVDQFCGMIDTRF
ncbi:MAG: beta-hexosaminidase [Clostridiales bacterium]|nr:beta-hexosaminidase [Clostridiales bacterium]